MKTAGVSLIGLLLGIGAGSLIVLAVVLFVTRGSALSREHFEQARITEDARVQMERLSDAIRDGQSLDLNGDGLATSTSEVWLQEAGEYGIVFYTNLDTDADLEQVRYTLEDTELTRGVTDPYDSGSEEVAVVARSLRNVSEGRPLFLYNGQSTPVNLANVETVTITLLVDVSDQDPGQAEVSTVVVPRASTGLAGVPSPSPSP